MSEAFEKVRGIRHLPLFPLPLVLLPNEILPLHIFEPRYRRLLDDLEGENGIFGVNLLVSDSGTADRPPAGSIGCAAEIKELQKLPDGTSNIITMGLARYRLLEYVETGDPYLVGDVEFYKDRPDDDPSLNELADEVFGLFERVAKAAFKLSGSRGSFPEIPRSDPEQLSFLISAAFNLDNEIKYELLELDKTNQRLGRLKELLVSTVSKMEESAEMVSLSKKNGHSTKKLDL